MTITTVLHSRAPLLRLIYLPETFSFVFCICAKLCLLPEFVIRPVPAAEDERLCLYNFSAPLASIIASRTLFLPRKCFSYAALSKVNAVTLLAATIDALHKWPVNK